MLFGIMNKYLVTVFSFLMLILSCNQGKKTGQEEIALLFPESGSLIKAGEPLKLSLMLSSKLPDSVQYFIDDKLVASAKDTATQMIDTKEMPLGIRLIQAKLYTGADVQELSTNIVLVSSKTPEQYGFKIINTYKHDVSSYTQGLEYHDGFFYESDGEYGASSLRKTTVEGKVLQQKDIAQQYFAEGMTVIGDKIIQLTYKERVILEYDKNTFNLLRTLPYNHAVEGWGLAYDGATIYNTDGSNKIYKLNKESYQPEGYIEVYDDKGPVTQLNELEWIDGKLFANIYTSDLIAIINPQTGEVEAYINLIGLNKEQVEDQDQDVLNGIAWDAKGKRLFVTGKKWPKLYQIEMVKR
ncbi:glutaminyl-peptide cyclotransferase [Pedobacter puniceum]|uniref:Glutaminyl-peptide cyclotransferase n=1 Tax=Pedobacter puniceum TaxID=2666136 RepID=A0A7K0FNM1_9SPHI|nr:glutaminyl-peptide cyclotransferase [Pedobacter puniceum]MRX47221.1 glutaminyl-peptide cyclotransferase [Pedobacter puniceum]